MLSSSGLSAGNEKKEMRRYFCPCGSRFSCLLLYLSFLALFLNPCLLSLPAVSPPTGACRDSWQCDADVTAEQKCMVHIALLCCLFKKKKDWFLVAAGGSDAPFLAEMPCRIKPFFIFFLVIWPPFHIFLCISHAFRSDTEPVHILDLSFFVISPMSLKSWA